MHATTILRFVHRWNTHANCIIEFMPVISILHYPVASCLNLLIKFNHFIRQMSAAVNFYRIQNSLHYLFKFAMLIQNIFIAF